MRLRVFLLIVAILGFPLAFAGCGGGGGEGPDRTLPTASDSAAPIPTAAVKPSSNPLAVASALPTEVPSELACKPVLYPSGDAGVPGRNFIRAVTRGTTRWGPGCAFLNPGDKCAVQWDGGFTVMAGEQAYLTFQAWVKGEQKVHKEITIGPLPAEQHLRRVSFPITIPKAPEIAFRIVLLDAAKRVAAISDSWSYRIDCAPGAR